MVNKISKTMTLDPELIEYVTQLAEKNGTNISHEVEKTIKKDKANSKRYEGLQGLDRRENVVESSPIYWSRKACYLLEDILDEIRNRK